MTSRWRRLIPTGVTLSNLDRHPTFSAAVSAGQDRIVITMHGDLDLPNVPALVDVLDAAVSDGEHLVADLADVRFVSLAGLYALVGVHREALSRGGSLALRSPSPALRRMIEASGHADELTVLAEECDLQIFSIDGFIDGEPANLLWTGSLGGSEAAVTRARLLADLEVPVGTDHDLKEITATTAEALPGAFLTAMAAFDTVTEAWFDLRTLPTEVSEASTDQTRPPDELGPGRSTASGT